MNNMKRILLSAALYAGLVASVQAAGGSTKSVVFTTSGYQGSAALANFPVLVRLSTAIEGFDYADVGADTNLVFKDSNGAVIPHEIDTWDDTGTSLVWVRVPSLTAATTFTMSYGGSDAAGANTPAAVWTGAGYVGVWHMDETAGTVADATGHGLAATPTPAEGASASVRYAGDAPVGHARQTGTSSTKCYLSVPSYDSHNVGDTFTMSGWVRLTENVANNPRLFSRKDSYSSNNGWEIEMATASPASFNVRGAARDKDQCKGEFSPNLQNRWTHVALVYDGSTCTVYTNGYELVSGTVTPATDNNLPLSIGCDSDGSEQNIRGAFDECRLLDAAASADWIAAEYATVADASFLAAGAATGGDSSGETRLDFLRKVSFTVDYADGAGLAGLPVLVRLSADNPAGFAYRDCAPGGSDLLFAGADGKPLPFEIDTWDTDGESLVWVKVPSVAQGTVFTMYYKGSSDAVNDPREVWTGYTGVWHLNALGADATPFSQGLYPNSTAETGIDGHLSTNSVAGEAGRFGKAFRTNDSTGPTAGNYNEGGAWVVDAGTDSPLDADGVFTISGWFKHANWNYTYDKLFFKRPDETANAETDGAFVSLIVDQVKDTRVCVRGSTGSYRVRFENAAERKASMIDNWVYLTIVFDDKTCSIYENGELCRSASLTVAAANNDQPLVFGNNTAIAGGASGSQAWNGWIDEVRYLKGAKSAEWIAAEYAAMADPSFLAAGSVESVGKSIVIGVR